MFGWCRILKILSQIISLQTLEVKLPSVENEKPIRVGEGGSLSRTDPCEMHFVLQELKVFRFRGLDSPTHTVNGSYPEQQDEG